MSENGRRIPFLEPEFPAADVVTRDYQTIVGNGRFSNGGAFEANLRRRIEVAVGNGVVAATVSNCTVGLMLALRACCVPRRRYVLVPSFTFPAGPLAIVWAGFEPLFIDIDPEIWQPKLVDARIGYETASEDIAGILLCDTFGVANPQIDQWELLGRELGLPIVIDAAAGFGARYPSGELLGARGTCEVFSFHATKTLAIGEGGAVTSRDGELIDRIRTMANFGFDGGRESTVFGLNAKLPELSAAIGLRQLDVLDKVVAERQIVFQCYRQSLEPIGAAFQPNAQWSSMAFVSVALNDAASKSRALSALEAAGIEAHDYYNPPVHCQQLFSEMRTIGDLPATMALASRIVSLPMSNRLRLDEVDRIATIVIRACGS